MDVEFKRVGLPYKIETAVDGRHLTPGQLAFVETGGSHLGSIGCWLSHRNVLLDLAENGPDMVAVFEDDARFTPELPSTLEALERKPFDFDIVNLEHRWALRRPLDAVRSLTEKVEAGFAKQSMVGTTGYVISRRAARRFIATTPEMTKPIDLALMNYWESGLSVMYLNPAVVYQDDGIPSQVDELNPPSPPLDAETSRSPIARLKRIGYHIKRDFAYRRMVTSSRRGLRRMST